MRPMDITFPLHPVDCTPLPLALPALSATEAQARTALAQRLRGVPVDCGGIEWRVSLLPAAPGGVADCGPGAWRLRASWCGASFELALPARLPRAWIEAGQPGLQVPELPDEYVAAALEEACGGLLDAMGRVGRGEAVIEGLSRGESPLRGWPHLLALEARADGAPPLLAWVGTDSLGLMQLAGLAADLPSARNELPTPQLPLRLRAEIGFTWLSVRELNELAPGDAVLLEQAFITPDREIWLGAGDWGLRAYWGDTSLTVTAALGRGGWTMTDDDDAGGRGRPAGLDDLPMRLAFDLGERSILLGELTRLQVGQTLDLGRPLSQAVNLRVHGSLVGIGELVDIDGRLGVVISALAGTPGAAASGSLHEPMAQESDEHDNLDDDGAADARGEAEEAWEQE
jgi:type III secretion protein Q